MKKAVFVALLLLGLALAMGALASELIDISFDDIGVTTAFPEDWVLVTPENVAEHLQFFDTPLAVSAANQMLAEGVRAIAFSPDGTARMRVIAQEDEQTALYFDIERYTPAMRTEIKNDFLDKKAWALTGFRCSEAEWKMRVGQGRLLWMVYTMRFGEETVARGRRVYTVRNGVAYTLDMQLSAPLRFTNKDNKLFEAFVASTAFPESGEMPPLPTALTLTDAIPEETASANFTLRGKAVAKSSVTAWARAADEEPALVGEARAAEGGSFTLKVTLPAEGEYQLFVRATLEGYAESSAGGWVKYDADAIPVSFTSLPSGDVYDATIYLRGKTLPGVTLQLMEGERNQTVRTGSDGAFSFRIDPVQTGERELVLAISKKGYEGKRFTINFNRLWHKADFIAYLKSVLKSLSYENLIKSPEKYVGRLVSYSGTVTELSSSGGMTYVRFALEQKRDGTWKNEIIAVTSDADVPAVGTRAKFYVVVEGENVLYSVTDAEGRDSMVAIPRVELLAYE